MLVTDHSRSMTATDIAPDRLSAARGAADKLLDQVPDGVKVGVGPWDRDGRPSYAKVERVLDVDPTQVRREGAVLPRTEFDAVVVGVQRYGMR